MIDINLKMNIINFKDKYIMTECDNSNSKGNMYLNQYNYPQELTYSNNHIYFGSMMTSKVKSIKASDNYDSIIVQTKKTTYTFTKSHIIKE